MTETLCIPAISADRFIKAASKNDNVELVSVDNYVRELLGIVYVTVSFDRPARLFDFATNYYSYEHRKPE